MSNIVYRKNKQFVINEHLLPESARGLDVINALYHDIYMEFRGASENPKYSQLNYKQKIVEINNFVNTWLKLRGYK